MYNCWFINLFIYLLFFNYSEAKLLQLNVSVWLQLKKKIFENNCGEKPTNNQTCTK